MLSLATGTTTFSDIFKSNFTENITNPELFTEQYLN